MTDDSVLIVEDSEAKLASVIAAVQIVLPKHSLVCAKSVRSAIQEVDARSYRIIIADMSLPTYDVESRERGGTPRPFGGIEVFDYLERRSLVTPIIVVSSYQALVEGSTSTSLIDLAAQLKAQYPHTYAGYVFFDSAYSTWERELQDLIKRIVYE
jgi:DNA-binding NtrC family response regulator